MTDGEELLDYLELFHFAVHIIGEDLNFLDIFRTGLAKILRSRVERFISELQTNTPSSPRLTETSFVHSESYQQLLSQITNQLRSIIDSIRKAKLWIPQGTGSNSQHCDPATIIGNVINSPNFKIEEVHSLRTVPTEKLTFSPDLTLYYTALFRATMSTDSISRCFSYALIRSAPQLFDPRHFFNVLKDALKIWEAQEVTFEFAASLSILLNSLTEIIHTILDDDIEELLYGLIETIPKSKNFSLLMVFDPTFKWILKSLPIESIQRVLDSSLELLKQGSHPHLCLICRSISRGIFGFDVLVPALQASLPFISEWSRSTQRESKALFGALVSRLPQKVIDDILNLLSATFQNENEAPTAVLVFSDFIINYFLNTTAPFHEALFDSVQKMMLRGVDANRVFAALCANPVRFLASVQKATDRSIFKLPFRASHTTLYSVLFARNDTSLLTADEVNKTANNFLDFANKVDEIDPLEFSVAQIETALRFSLWPGLFHDFLSQIESPNEDIKYYLIQILYTIAIRESNVNILHEFTDLIPSIRYECEYSEMIRLINQIMENQKPSHFEILRAKVPPSIADVFVVGSKTLVGLSLLFQYTIWSEPGNVPVCFKRTRILSTEWFAFVASSLFVTIFNEPEEAIEPTFIKFSNDSPLYFVWFAVALTRKLCVTWFNAIADENYSDMIRLMLYPKIPDGFNESDIQYAISLHKKYQEVFHQFLEVINFG